ncbi:hypothetical protein EES43_28710 [Streptomyces sp. ADI96-02]|uniref:FUSC family protein n=1 Tax=Streptomyces sp. ADI96-02 TaxID=1522760 RepID=UPI000FA6F889|nr:FUSC family protein [Streptomyces sp. ADI96-02]RPK54558.1 hypothetical protein EES43_28710 [Streptomyces sp. ADI96-02]
MSAFAPRAARFGHVRDTVAAEGPAAARIVVTVAVAWQVAVWLGSDSPPVYAAVVPLVALRGDPGTALAASLQRVLGVMAGVLIGIAVLNVLHPSTASLTLVVALGLVAGMFLRAGGPLNVQVPASSLLVFASASPDAYAFHRFWETVAGAVVTMVLAPLLWPPDPRRTLTALADVCRTHLTQALMGTVAALDADADTARDNLTAVTGRAEAVRAHAVRAREAERAMRFNPLRRRHRGTVDRLVRGVALADRLAPHLTALAGEVALFTGRDDLAPALADARRHLPAVAASTAEAITRALEADEPGIRPRTGLVRRATGHGPPGDRPTAGPRAPLTAARARLAVYGRVDDRPAAVALRRPFQQVLDDLDEHLAP